MSGVDFSSGLDETIAQQFVEPAVSRAVDMLHDSAKMHAPTCRVWVTMEDDRVRRSHIKTNGQIIPDNLRFLVPKVGAGDDPGDQRSGYDLARFPRDPSLPIGNRINCRCADPVLPQPLKESIKKTLTSLVGTRVEASVYTDFPRAAESEFGTSADTPAYFMTKALTEVATRLRAGHSR